MNRAEAIRNFLAARNKPATVGEVQAGLDDLREAEGLTHEQFARRVSAQIAQLLKSGKVLRTGLLGSYRYALAPDGLRDRRAQAAVTRAQRQRRAAPTTRKRTEEADAPPRQRDTAPRAGALGRMPPPTTPPPGPAKVARRQQLAADVAAFLAAGGRIQRLANGESSQPLLHTRREIEARPGRLGKRRIHDEEPDDLDVAA